MLIAEQNKRFVEKAIRVSTKYRVPTPLFFDKNANIRARMGGGLVD